LIAAVVCAGGLIWASSCGAQGPGAVTPPPVNGGPEQGMRWAELKPAQQASLKPLQQEWSGIDGPSKQKWLALSGRYSKLTPDEQARVQARMREWSKLTPRERGEARLHFQEAKQLPREDREARWKAYQALSPEQRQQLAARAAANSKPPARAAAVQMKSNIVPNPEYSAPPRAITPTVVQAGPGATTTLITKRPTPPGHQQTGMPKIAATPEFVNKSTLLPQRGPQGAAARGAVAPAPETAPRR
jgi:hypothetical protein